MDGCTVISGASGGIGAALARHLAERPGAALALLGRDEARLDAVAAACRERGATVVTGTVDVREREALANWLHELDDRQPVGSVIANAGIAASSLPGGHPEQAQHVYEVLDVNLWGALNLVLPLVPRFKARRRGRVVLMSSLSAFAPLPGAESYSASKAALLAYGLALRGQLAADGVAVNVVCPGFVTSAMSQRFRGWKPMEIDADDAARRILRGLERDARLIAFPLPVAVAARLTPFIPEGVLRHAMRLFRL